MLFFCFMSMEFAPDGDNRSIDECLLAVKNGDREALGELYSLTSSSVYSFALSILRNAHDAEDVLHDCYVSIWNSVFGYHSQSRPMGWVITVAKNLCLMKLRERSRSGEMPKDYELEGDGESFETDDRLLVRECLTALSDEERQIVVLHAVAGLRHREIAEITAISLPNVLSKYNRALKKLREYLLRGETL